MKSQLKFRVIAFAVFSLLFGLTTPIEVASGATNITKTFIVKGPDDALIQGAYVSVMYRDLDTLKTVMSSPVTTNASGQVQIQVPENALSLSYTVFPPANNTSMSPTLENYQISNTISESIQVKLLSANLTVQVNAPNGSSVLGTEQAALWFPRSNQDGTSAGANASGITRILRSGPFGITLPKNLDPSLTYMIRTAQYRDAWIPGRFNWQYGLKATGTSGSQTYSVYTDVTAATLLSQLPGGAYPIAYKGPTLQGVLTNSDGSTLTLPANVRASLSIVPDFVSTVPGSGSSEIFNNGNSPKSDWSWSAYNAGPAGKYLYTFTFEGTSSIPSHSGFIWKNGAGGFSTSPDGPFSTANQNGLHQLTLKIPGPANLKIKVVEPGTSTALAARVTLTLAGTSTFVSSAELVNGELASIIQAGQYDLSVTAINQMYKTNQYRVEVSSNGSVIVKTASGNPLTASGDVFSLAPIAPNFKIQAVSSLNANTVIQNADFQVREGTSADGKFVAGNTTGTTFGGTYLENGTYTVTVWPGKQSATYRSKQFTIQVSNGLVSVTTQNSGVSLDANNILKVPLPAKNFQFTVKNSANTVVEYSGIEYQKVDNTFNRSSIDWNNSGGTDADTSGNGGATLAAGYWLVSTRMGPSSTDAKKTYKVTIGDNGAVTSVKDASNNDIVAVEVDGISRYPLVSQTSNVIGSLKNASNTNVVIGEGQGINVELQKWNGQWWEWKENSYRNNATYGFSVSENGKYRVFARPNGFDNLSQAFSSEFEITNGTFSNAGSATVNGSGQLVLDVVLPTPNFRIKLVDPRGDKPLMRFGWVTIMKIESNMQSWVGNMDINYSNPGLAGVNLSDGTYRLDVNPRNGDTVISGLANQSYFLTVTNSGQNFALTLNGENQTIGSDGRYVLNPGRSNITGRVVNQSNTPLTSGMNKWVNVQVQKWLANENRWDWTSNGTNVDSQGFFSLAVSTVGKYRLRIEPNGFENVTTTNSSEFEITAENRSSFELPLGNFKLSAPALRAKVMLSDGTSAITYTGIAISKNGNWLESVSTSQSGIASFAFADVGTYELTVWPNPQEVNSGATKKTYTATVTKNSEGAMSASISGLTPGSDGVYILRFGTGNVSGFVCQPTFDCSSDSSKAIRDAQVVPVEVSTSRELWEYAANTSSTGKWSLSLPNGTYKILARAPWGTSDYGNSDALGTFTVSGSSVVASDQADGLNVMSLKINLKSPTWKGIVRAPDNSPVPYASICLYTQQLWNCTNANASGNWALSAPNGFTAFSSDAMLQVRDDRTQLYPMLQFAESSAVSTALGGVSNQSVTLQFKGSNFQVKVLGAGSAPIQFAWVSLDRAGGLGWLGGGQTNAQGIASFSIDTATVTGDINIRIDVNGNKALSTTYAPTTKTITLAAANSWPNPYMETVTLNSPNLLGLLREPGASGNTVAWAWIELFDDATGEWKGGSNTNQNGQFSILVPKPASGPDLTYTLKVNPRWDSTSLLSSRSYTLTINTANQISIKVKGTNTAPAIEGQYTLFTLASPSVTGTVVKGSDTPVRDSWIVPISNSTGEYFWQQGTNSKSNGSFAMSLADGTYKLEANVPWNESDLAKSSQCTVVIAGGQINGNPTGCTITAGSIKLSLRSPNVTLTLKYGGTAIANANVGVNIGNWYTNARSKSDGKVSLFIDRAAVLAANPNMNQAQSQKINIWVDPPYGRSDIVRWSCQSGDNKPICNKLSDFNPATEYSNALGPIGDVSFQGPNTKVKILKPDSSNLQNAWVNLFGYVGNSLIWLGGSNTDSSGIASFNVETGTVSIPADTKFRVEVNPPWNSKSTYSQKSYGETSDSALTWAQINYDSGAGSPVTFTIGSPNVKLAMKSPSNEASPWGWFGIEEVNSSNGFVKWISGIGTDNLGGAAATLSANKRYRITANPGPGRVGTRTECIVTTDGAVAVSIVSCSLGSQVGADNLLSIKLSSGNVSGQIKYGTLNVAGAIVVATSGADIVTATSAEDGTFGLQLDSTKSWTLKVFPVNSSSGLQYADKNHGAITFSGGNATVIVELALKA